ncbi:hypothetical protein [Paenibacillus turpanensis]|uniref:hypothetical protein n=1 Tax=Paenibacillus turpanensis TaxID=2689078 RepID=UPI001409542B|nr:hypothetical protein [Paenibacillus turpanensis]
MTIIQRSIMFILVLLLAGCSFSNPTSGETENGTAPHHQEGSASPSRSVPPSEAQTGSTRSDPIIGKPLKEQSFQVNFENLGDTEFITTIETINGKDRPHFYLKKGDSVTELKYEPESPESFYTVSAVSFREINGVKDIIVILDYTTGFGQMGAIPVSQLLIFTQSDSGFVEQKDLEKRVRAGVPYRILTIDDVLTGLQTDPKESISKAWQRVKPGFYHLEGSNELAGSILTIEKTSGESLIFSIDAIYASSKEAMESGGPNIGTIHSGKAVASNGDMVYRDGEFELTISLLSNKELYVRDNGKTYFGYNVNVTGRYTLE